MNKKFEIVDEDDNSYRRLVPLSPEAQEIIEETRRNFERHFERPHEGSDPVFLEKYLVSDADIERQGVRAMETAGIDPALIYAYKKTGYVVTESGLDGFTGAAIDEWDAAIDEYEAHGGEPVSPEEKAFDRTLESLPDEIESMIYTIGLANDKFFNTELLFQHTSDNAILTPLQYQALCVCRVHRTLRSVRVLEKERMSEDVIKLARTIYECYLHTIFSQQHPESLEILVDAVIGLRRGTHQYKKRKDGGEDKRYVVNLRSGKELPSQISSYKMATSSPFVEDEPFFDFFYQTTSLFIHPSALSLDAYLSSNGLDPIKPHMYEEAIIYVTCVSIMTIDRIRKMPGCPKGVIRDCLTVVNRIRGKLLTLLDQLQVWQMRMGATAQEISILRSRCDRLGEP